MKLARQILLALVLPATVALPVSAQTEENEAELSTLPLQELRIFADVFNQIRRTYVEEVTDKQLLEDAVRGMLAGLDPHSTYLDKASYEDLQTSTSGEFAGLGIEVTMENGFVKVISPIDGSPADLAGIQPGDLIVELDKQPVKGLSLGDAVNIMRGLAGTKITLTILREGQKAPVELELIRAKVRVSSVKSRVLEPGYGYLRLAQFQQNSVIEMKAALAELHQQGLKGLVLDLRNNPGGLLEGAAGVTDMFIDDGVIVSTRGQMGSAYTEIRATNDEPADQTPMVVLINGGSASASEIVAGALQDAKRAVIMGTQSFGKGSVQQVRPISKDRAIKLTTARYYTPSGRSIQALGITPDIVVQRARMEKIEEERYSEADLNRHLGPGRDQSSSRPTSTADLLSEDNQLYEALNLLKGMNIMERRRSL